MADTQGDPRQLLGRLIRRGDVVAITGGRLCIEPASGKPIPAAWLKEHNADLCRAVVEVTGQTAYEYQSYSARRFDGKFSGVNLQLTCITTGKSATVFFNADLIRDRDTKSGKKGAPLPPGQFRPRKGSAFVSFWLSTGQPIPKGRLSVFYEFMGNLRGILFTAQLSRTRDRLTATTLLPLTIATAQIRAALLPPPSRATDGQATGNTRTSCGQGTDKHHGQGNPAGLGATGVSDSFQYGTLSHKDKVIRNCGNTGQVPPSPEPQPIDHQSDDGWWSDYDAGNERLTNRPPSRPD